jgi:hypothetical protein
MHAEGRPRTPAAETFVSGRRWLRVDDETDYGRATRMATIEGTIDVDVPGTTA